MLEERTMIARHKSAVAALEQNFEKVTSVAQSLMLGCQAIESTHLLQTWFQDQVQSLEQMLHETGLDLSISDAMPSDPFAALAEGNTVKDLMATFNRALERLEQINEELQAWTNDYSKEGARMEGLRRDLQHKVLSAQGEVLEIVQQRRASAHETIGVGKNPDATTLQGQAPRIVKPTHPASPWVEAANVTIPPTPDQPHGRTTPVTPESLGSAATAPYIQDEDTPPSPSPPQQEAAAGPAVAPLSTANVELAQTQQVPPVEEEDAEDFSNRSPRVAIEVPVSVKSATRLWFATSENCSETGIFVSTPFVVPMGTRVTLELLFPGNEPMPVTGEVAWTREDHNESSGSGMGVRLLDISDELEQKLKQLLPEEQTSN